MINTVEPFIILYGPLLHENYIADLTTPRRDLLQEAYSQCTFKPNTNGLQNQKLAKRKYEKDLITNALEIEAI
jgi:hypothetical protein